MVVAHELGHVKEHDVAIGTTLGALGVLAAVGALTLLLTGRGRAPRMPAGQVAVVPVVLALSAVGSLLASPVQSGASRAIEARADRISLQALGHEQTFIDLHRRLALRSYADPTPPAWSQWWFGSHPTVLQRVAIARALSAQQ